MKKKFLEQKGSMAIYVAVVLLSFVLILSSIYATSMSVRKSELRTAVKIKESYELYNNEIETIYQNQLNKTN